jgi:hypothetical protein
MRHPSIDDTGLIAFYACRFLISYLRAPPELRVQGIGKGKFGRPCPDAKELKKQNASSDPDLHRFYSFYELETTLMFSLVIKIRFGLSLSP